MARRGQTSYIQGIELLLSRFILFPILPPCFSLVFICNIYFYSSLCSAVDQFRKQFAHLEENGGKNGAVVPLDRKHVSLPR